jgi:hypothetical protein
MKNWNFVYTCIAIVVYVILITLFFNHERVDFYPQDKTGKFSNCTFENPCVTFCEHSNYDKYSDDFIRKNFPFGDFLTSAGFYETYDGVWRSFEIMKNNFECRFGFDKTKILDDLSEVNIYTVRNVFK